MTINPLWQRCQDAASIGCHPPLALVTGRAHRNHEILNQKRLVTLEARSWRDRGVHDPLFDGDPRSDLAPASPLHQRTGLRWLGTFFHAARPDSRASFQAFQTRVLLAQLTDNLFQGGDFAKQFNQQSLKLWTVQPGKREWRRHIPVENRPPRAGAREKSGGANTFAPLTSTPANSIRGDARC